MKPNDENGKRPVSERPFRVLLLAGSDRRQYNCPGVDSKARALTLRLAERLPSAWEIDVEDLGNVYGRAKIQSCNACVSTSMALCCWPCLPASERVHGTRLRSIADLRPGDEVSTGQVTAAWCSSPRASVYRVRLSDGRQVRLTANHPVKVVSPARRTKVNGRWTYTRETAWAEAGRLRLGDRVPFPLGSEAGAFADDSGLDPFYFLLAGLVFGDGTFAGTGQVRLFFDARQPAVAEAVGALSPVPVDVRRQAFSARDFGWPCAAGPFMRYLCWSVAVGRVLLERIGLNKRAPVAERRLPQAILEGSETEACAFLRGWFSADGSVDVHGGNPRVSLCSSSVGALRDAQILLAKLGIRASVYDMSRRTVRVGERDYARASLLRIHSKAAVAEEPFEDERQAYAQLVWQCRWSGIEVPDRLWAYADTGVGKPYADDQAEDMEDDFLAAFDAWADRFAAFVAEKGKVPPGEHRAFGYDPPGHLLEDAGLAWRDIRMRLGIPRAGSSPQVQQEQGLNEDATLFPKKSEQDRRDG